MHGWSGRFPVLHAEMVIGFLTTHTRQIEAAIHQEPEDYILNVNEIEYINHIMQQFAFDCPRIDFDAQWASRYEMQLLPYRYPEQFPLHFRFGPYETVPTWVIVYHLSFTGSIELLRCATDLWRSIDLEVSLEESEDEKAVCFEVIDFHNNGVNIQRQEPNMINSIRFLSGAIINDAEPYCARLPIHIEELFKARKKHLLDTHHQLVALGVPLRKRDNVPGTYASDEKASPSEAERD